VIVDDGPWFYTKQRVGEVVIEIIEAWTAMRILSHNLAIAGALCAAYAQGAERHGGVGFYPGDVFDEEQLARRLGFVP
jgi:hypothetical protein